MNVLLTASELAKRLNVTPPTIHAWHRQGKIPCLRAGRRPVLFDYEAVVEALRDGGKPQLDDATSPKRSTLAWFPRILMPDGALLSRDEAADALGVTPGVLRMLEQPDGPLSILHYLDSPDIPLYDRREIQALVDEKETEGGAK